MIYSQDTTLSVQNFCITYYQNPAWNCPGLLGTSSLKTFCW